MLQSGQRRRGVSAKGSRTGPRSVAHAPERRERERAHRVCGRVGLCISQALPRSGLRDENRTYGRADEAAVHGLSAVDCGVARAAGRARVGRVSKPSFWLCTRGVAAGVPTGFRPDHECRLDQPWPSGDDLKLQSRWQERRRSRVRSARRALSRLNAGCASSGDGSAGTHVGQVVEVMAAVGGGLLLALLREGCPCRRREGGERGRRTGARDGGRTPAELSQHARGRCQLWSRAGQGQAGVPFE